MARSQNSRAPTPNATRAVVVVAIAVALVALALLMVVAVKSIDESTRITTDRAARRPGAAAPAPTTTTPSPGGSAPAAPGSGEIADLAVAQPHPDGYDRDLFGAGGWTDADGDCQNTRSEVLIAESRVPVSFTTSASCTVLTGEWLDPWSGTTSTSAGALDVDHTVPLANAWRSGAWTWAPAQRVAFANDLADAGHLIAIPLGENRAKGDDGPEAWRPPARSASCAYAQIWTAIKARWGLTASPAEWSALLEMAATC